MKKFKAEDKTFTSMLVRNKELAFPTVVICPKDRKPFKSSWRLGEDMQELLLGQTPNNEVNLTIHSKEEWLDIWNELNYSLEEILDAVEYFDRVQAPTKTFEIKQQVRISIAFKGASIFMLSKV